MIQSIELRRMRADVVAVRQILHDAIAADDLLGRFQYEGRVRWLEDELRVFEESLHGLGEAIVEFAGGTHLGSSGVDLWVANRAIESFSRLIVLQASSLKQDVLGLTRANVESCADSLSVTVTCHGFILREIPQVDGGQASMIPQAIHQIAVAIAALADDSSDWSDLLTALDQDARAELKTFFATLDDVQARVAIFEGDDEIGLSAKAVRRARVRLDDALGVSSLERAQVPQHTAHRPAHLAPCHP